MMILTQNPMFCFLLSGNVMCANAQLLNQAVLFSALVSEKSYSNASVTLNISQLSLTPFISVLKGSTLETQLLKEDVCKKYPCRQSMPLLIWQDNAPQSPPLQGAALATPHHLPRTDPTWLCVQCCGELCSRLPGSQRQTHSN